MKKNIMAVTFDAVHYQNNQIEDLVAIINNGNYNSIKWLEYGSNPCKYMVAHAESFQIFQSLIEEINQEYRLDLQFQQVDENGFNEIRWIQKFDLTRLNRFDGFRGLIGDDVRISIIIDNNYHLNGHLEVSLAMTFDGGQMIVFDKWSPQNGKHCFRDVMINVEPGYDNFINRHNLINQVALDIFEDFKNSLSDLIRFLRNAQIFQINGVLLKAVYLDLKDRNRSFTNLKLSKDNRKKIKEDLDYVNRNIYAYDNALSYVDFIRVIGIPQPEFRYNKNIEFELTASRAYKTLIKMVEKFSNDNQDRQEYEAEQVQTLLQIEQILDEHRF
jgi:hypothetical protein